ncbi:hypothetical protein F4778DRAFT_766331 [Xylariomycetidae sp. FL2044]|nr:hypothetical protein F4778DRAFT_766274 [Xylariomycetidae sp. FL2044]KAH9883559.1 hypothetical protein F4778DRAFT_766331 [Xylariomycetidae sp. FL2044]
MFFLLSGCAVEPGLSSHDIFSLWVSCTCFSVLVQVLIGDATNVPFAIRTMVLGAAAGATTINPNAKIDIYPIWTIIHGLLALCLIDLLDPDTRAAAAVQLAMIAILSFYGGVSFIIVNHLQKQEQIKLGREMELREALLEAKDAALRRELDIEA